MDSFSFLGFGVGLRHEHFDVFRSKAWGSIDWVEALTENYLPWEDKIQRRPLALLEKIRKDLPVVLHGVSMSIGSSDPLKEDYLIRLKELCQRIEPVWVSDHLCWTGVDRENLHDLLPLPYTEEAIKHIVNRIDKVQNILGRAILIENVSSYAEYSASEMSEWDFVSEISKRADCGILLDVNNIYVSSYNHGFDPKEYIKAMPKEKVIQIHLAGHTNKGTHLIDTHDEHVCKEVWDLYRFTLQELGPISSMIEWDDQIPEWKILEAEINKARQIHDNLNKREENGRKIKSFGISAAL